MSACEATSGCYELYSIGSAKFLREIFNSVAMITGSGDFLGACVVAIMLGVILAVIKGIMTGGGKIEVGAIVVSSLVTCIMFVPRATVVVEDVYNGSTYAVDNVPIGVAAPGMFISRVGFTIAELMDQGFSTVDTNFGITNRPFLESTKILSNLRNPQFANSVWDQLGKHTNSDVKRSFYNFFKECTMLKYNFDKTKSVDQDQKMTLENLMDDFQSNVFYTEIYVDGKAVTKTCNDANAILKSKINQLNGDLVNNAMPAPKEYGSNTATEMTDAISMLRLTSADAMEMVKLSIVQPVYDKALAGYFDNSGDVVAALTINNAIQQRNAQWSMEQSLFLNTVRPIITFFEGFVYAVTPFMAILICMGAFGLGIAIKYFQTLIWIQLWMPILAIINLYIYMSAQGAVDSAGIVDKHIDSFYALGTLAQTVETWTSVGGMLAAMTPVIAFFIVAGSAYTFTSIASKLNGADHIDEKAMSPDIIKQAPFATNTAGSYKISSTGAMYSDRENQLPSIGFGYSDFKSIQSAYQAAHNTQTNLGKKIGDAFAHNITYGQGWGSMENISNIVGHSGNSLLQASFNKAVELSNSTGTDLFTNWQNTYNAMASQARSNMNHHGEEKTMNVGGGGNAGGSKTPPKMPRKPGDNDMPKWSVLSNVSGMVNANYQVNEGEQNSDQNIISFSNNSGTGGSANQKTTEQTSDNTTLAKGDNHTLSFSKALSDAASNYYQTNGGVTDSMGLTAEETKAFNESWQDVKQYGNTVGEKFDSNWKQEVSLKDLANDVNNSEDGKSRIAKLYNGFDNSQRERVASLSNLYRDKFGIENADLAKSMAVLQTAYQGSTENKNEVFDLFNDNFGGNRQYSGQVSNPNEYAGNQGQSEEKGKPVVNEFDKRKSSAQSEVFDGLNKEQVKYNGAKQHFDEHHQKAEEVYKNNIPSPQTDIKQLDDRSADVMLRNQNKAVDFGYDKDGKVTSIVLNGVSYDQQAFEKNKNSIFAGIEYLHKAFGLTRENVDMTTFGPQPSNIDAKKQYYGKLGNNEINLLENGFLDTSTAGIKKNPYLIQYAKEHNFDLNDQKDLEKMQDRAKFINGVIDARNGKIGINYDTKMNALLAVIRNDEARVKLGQSQQDIDNMRMP